jgi:L-galactose dehydrogenase
MEYRTLGRTGFEVSLLSLGSGGARVLGQALGYSQDQQTALVRRALDLGVNLIDTSSQYGDSEAILGRALAGVPRDSYFLTTKWLVLEDGKLVPDPALLTSGVEESLSRLRTDYVDVMMFHGPMPDEYPDIVDKVYPAMERLREQGKVRAVGISTRYVMDAAQVTADLALERNPELFDVVMVKYGILNQHAAVRMLPRAIEHDVGVMNMAVIREKLPDPALLEQLIRDWKAAGHIPAGALPDEDPLGWLLHDDVDSVVTAGYRFAADHPAIATVITGTASISHLEANAAALETPRLSCEDTKRLKDLFGHIVDYA